MMVFRRHTFEYLHNPVCASFPLALHSLDHTIHPRRTRTDKVIVTKVAHDDGGHGRCVIVRGPGRMIVPCGALVVAGSSSVDGSV